MILAIGGNFGEHSRESGLFKKIIASLCSNNGETVVSYNGGSMDLLKESLNYVPQARVVLWFANVPNTEDKIIHRIKAKNRKVILITSKRNNDEYSFQELIAHSLSVKANLTVTFTRRDEGFAMRVHDPLGNVWVDSCFDVDTVFNGVMQRANSLADYTRQGVVKSSATHSVVPIDAEFMSYIRSKADVFHELISPSKTTRFLGNSSFRCTKGGFPSMCKDGDIYMSKRNVDKSDICVDGFVPVYFDGDAITYDGDHKPSVDTPIQVRLYKHYDKALYMIHAHVYLEEPTFTTTECIPCGAVEEFKEIVNAVPDKEAINFGINLKGHGSLIIADSVEAMKKFTFVKRGWPEIQD